MADSSKDAQKYWWIKNKQIGIGWLDDVKDSDDQLYYSLISIWLLPRKVYFYLENL